MSALKLLNQLIVSIESIGSPIKLLFITGRAGAGKTTLGENFKSKKDWIHFDGDQFAYGHDPVQDSGKTVQPQGKDEQKKSQELIDAYDNGAVKNGYNVLFQGKTPDLSVWRPFYDLLIAKLNTIRIEYPNKNIAISHSVYKRSVRDYIRKQCGKNTYFIILYPALEISTERAHTKVHDIAASVGETADEYLNKWGTSYEQLKEVTAPMIQKGFDKMEQDEPNSYQIDVNKQMTKLDVFQQAQNLLGSTHNVVYATTH